MAGEGAYTPSKNGDKSVTIPAIKYDLMLRVIGQLQQGRSINWSTIHHGDKAKKTLTNMWVRVRAEIAALEPSVAEENVAVNPPRSAKKRAAKGQSVADESDSSPTKKSRIDVPVTPSKSLVKAEETEEDSMVKQEIKAEEE